MDILKNEAIKEQELLQKAITISKVEIWYKKSVIFKETIWKE